MAARAKRSNLIFLGKNLNTVSKISAIVKIAAEQDLKKLAASKNVILDAFGIELVELITQNGINRNAHFDFNDCIVV